MHIIYHSNSYYTATLTFHVYIIYHSNGYYTATAHFPRAHYIPFKWLLHCHLSLSTCILYTIQMVITLPPLTFHVHIIYHSNGYYTATSHFPHTHYIPFKWLLHCHLSLSTYTLYTIQMVITLPLSTCTLYTIQIVITLPPLTFHVHIIYHSNGYYTATSHFPRTHYIPFK